VSWRFAYSPKWIVRHVLVVLLVTSMILLMFWQLGRLHDKKAFKHLAERHEEQPARPVEELLPVGAHLGDQAVTDVLYRKATAVGTYLADRTITVENRTDQSDSPGAWVLTPLDLGGNRAVLVNRGFLGYDVHGKIVAPPPPTGEVRVSGLLFPTQTRGFFGAKDPKTGVLTVMARVDLRRVDAQVDEDVLPAYLQLTTSRPAQPPAPKGTPESEALGPPDISEGPHFSYAVQWAIFSTIAAGGYLLLLRKVALQEGAEARVTDDPTPGR
jgi:cytochrome oxidase assembly protein ShyY1